MTNEKIKLQNFMENFFKKIKADVEVSGNLIIISNVNPKFEKVYGKKSPYHFVLDSNNLKLHPSAELLKKGHLILRVASEFLENTAQTGLLKIDFGINCEDEIKKRLKLQNCEINKIDKIEENSYVYRFTFKTIIQHQNEREEVITEIYIKDKNILEKFEVEAFKTIEGRKSEIEIEGVKESYPLAKNLVKERLHDKLEEISQKLEVSIDKETKRIDKHYSQLIEEILNEYKRTEKQFLDAKKSLKIVTGENKEKILEKLNRINQTIERIKREGKYEQLKKEKEFFLNDEKHKHSINLKNSLLNTTIIYYPKYKLKVFLKYGDSTFRQIKLTLDPMSNSISKIKCDSCGDELDEIILCSSGHLTCRNCGDICTCNRVICKSCRKIKCEVCDRSICTKCSKKCSKCNKEVCETHSHKDFMTGKYICDSCSEKCGICGNFTEKNYFKNCEKCGKRICPKCRGSGLSVEVGKIICKNCV